MKSFFLAATLLITQSAMANCDARDMDQAFTTKLLEIGKQSGSAPGIAMIANRANSSANYRAFRLLAVANAQGSLYYTALLKVSKSDCKVSSIWGASDGEDDVLDLIPSDAKEINP